MPEQSTPSAVVVPAGATSAADTAAVTEMKGGAMLSPLPYGQNGGRRHRTKKLSKKVLNMFKKGSRSKLMKMMKGGNPAETAATVGGRRHTKRHRKH